MAFSLVVDAGCQQPHPCFSLINSQLQGWMSAPWGWAWRGCSQCLSSQGMIPLPRATGAKDLSCLQGHRVQPLVPNTPDLLLSILGPVSTFGALSPELEGNKALGYTISSYTCCLVGLWHTRVKVSLFPAGFTSSSHIQS